MLSELTQPSTAIAFAHQRFVIDVAIHLRQSVVQHRPDGTNQLMIRGEHGAFEAPTTHECFVMHMKYTVFGMHRRMSTLIEDA